MPYIRYKFLFLILSLLISNVYSQNFSVSGTVYSTEDNSTIPGVNIVVKGKKIGTITDIDGKFAIQNINSEDTLVFSFISFRTLLKIN